MKLSVIVPVYKGEQSIGQIVEKIIKELKDVSIEIILVNDGSPDKSGEICEEAANRYPNIKYICLRKNFGEHNAVMCGLNYAEGEYAVIIDDDFQNPPHEILKLLEEIEKGYDVVYSKYNIKYHNIFRNLCSKFNNKVADILINKPKGLYLSSFKIIRKEVIAEIIKYKGPFPYIDGLILRVTDNISSVYVEHNKSFTGKSSYSLKKLISLYLNMFLNFSIKPLRIFTITGFIVFIIGVILSLIFIIEKFIYNEPPGWTSTVLIILLFSGFQIIFLGLIGEYLGKQYLDQNNTPQWIVKKTINNEQ